MRHFLRLFFILLGSSCLSFSDNIEDFLKCVDVLNCEISDDIQLIGTIEVLGQSLLSPEEIQNILEAKLPNVEILEEMTEEELCAHLRRFLVKIIFLTLKNETGRALSLLESLEFIPLLPSCPFKWAILLRCIEAKGGDLNEHMPAIL